MVSLWFFLINFLVFLSIFFGSYAIENPLQSKIQKKPLMLGKKNSHINNEKELAGLSLPEEIVPKISQKIYKWPEKSPMVFSCGGLKGHAQIKFKPESFYLKNTNLVNNNVDADDLFLSRSTIDFNFGLNYAQEAFDYNIAEFFLTFRNKSVWGNLDSIAQTTTNTIKELEVVFGEHRHFLTRHVIWLRELWLKFNINTAFGLHFGNNHFFTLGAFPFELGRGIALGSAYAVGPRVLGFWSNIAIDQYAFGFKFSGDLFPDRLSYDMYAAILDNKGDSFANTGKKIRGQEYGHEFRQERGPGKINYIVAGRLRWVPKNDGYSMATFEPYVFFNHDPEQQVEFFADASGKLGSLGLAGEFIQGRFECGFDTAFNVGHQTVHGWDRNETHFENRNPTDVYGDARVVVINERVVTQDPEVNSKPPRASYDPNSTTGKFAQRIINQTPKDNSQNGKFIGSVDGVDLFNDLNRFRNPYRNYFRGKMAVFDCAWSLNQEKTWKVAGTVGIATGGDNPNQALNEPSENQVSTTFNGFIGLQEIYAGNRVKSIFLLGGTGRVPRPLTVPVSPRVFDRLPTVVSGFTNIVFVGSGLHCLGNHAERKITWNPNVLAYWQEHPTKAFDIATNMSSDKDARKYLGLEVNSLFDATLFSDCKLYFVTSVFIPGVHYKDIKGTPITKDQQKILDNRDRTGIIDDKLPLLGDDLAYTLNIGIECRF